MATNLPLPPVDLSATGRASGAFRTPPHNVEAEKALLGAIMANNRAYERVSEFLRGEHFALGQHGKIFEACARLIERGQIADPVTLKNFFEQADTLADIGGPAYIADLATAAVGIINAGEYGRLIYDLYLKRQLIVMGEDMVNDAFGADMEHSATEQIQVVEQKLYDLASSGEIEGGFRSFRDSLKNAVEIAQAAHQRQGQLSGVTTGLRDINAKLGGLHSSDLLILAGRPSMGKTALATNIAFNAAKAYREERGEDGKVKVVDGAVVGFFSLEMSAEQLATRILSEQARIGSDKIRKGLLSNDEFNRLVVAAQEVEQLPIYIDDSPGLTVSALRTRARRLKRQHGLGLIVIDYLQLMSASPGSADRGRVQEVSEITRGLKTLAKELEVPVLALSQLSRQVENRDDKRPQLADLRESGSIEQDADVVMFIFRAEYYLSRGEPIQRADEAIEKYTQRHEHWVQRCEEVHNKAEVIVAKQRHGPIGSVDLFFEGEFTRFGDLDTQHGEAF
ncbi:MAG: replicative DNA helicase [Magnetospirillum sp. WYHS-4]